MEDILDSGSPKQHDDLNGPSLEHLASNGYKFDFGKCFERGWEAMKSDIGQYILFALVAGVIIVVSLFTVIGAILIALPLQAGYMVYAKKVLTNEPREFNDFFGGFKYFTPLLGYVGVMILVGLILAVPLGVVMGINFAALGSLDALDNPDMVGAQFSAIMLPFQFLFMIIGVFLGALLFFAIPLIVIGQLKTVESIRWSIKLALKNFWWLLLYAFVVSLIQQAGAFACYVGLLFTFPLSQCLLLGAYAEIVGLGDKRTTTVG
jgi:uncharacterized membrane protein